LYNVAIYLINKNLFLKRISSGKGRRVVLVKSDFSEEGIASNIRMEKQPGD
jgi:hypothetical protein